MLPDLVAWVHFLTKRVVSFQHHIAHAALGHTVPAYKDILL